MYGTVGAADQYFAERMRPEWAARTEEERTAAMHRASTALEALFLPYFIRPLDLANVPVQVEQAVYELALVEATQPGLFFKIYDPTKAAKRVTVGPITKEYALLGGDVSYVPRLVIVEGLLRTFMRGKGFLAPAILSV